MPLLQYQAKTFNPGLKVIRAKEMGTSVFEKNNTDSIINNCPDGMSSVFSFGQSSVIMKAVKERGAVI